MKPIQFVFLAVLFFLCTCQPQATQPAATTATAAAATAASTAAAPTLTSLPPTPTSPLTAVPLLTALPSEEPLMNQVPFPTPLDASASAIVEQARQDLGKRLSIDPSQIELVEAIMVTWPDGSLGCPQPGMAYTQTLVDGYRLRFGAGGQVYSYHGSGDRPPFLCEQGS